MFERPIVMLDFETTGLSPESGDRITEVAALRIAGGEIVDRYVSLVNCGVRIPPFITSLTGISQQMVDSAPPAGEVVPELIEFIGCDTLAAHNASFDEKFLKAEGARLGHDCRHAGLVCSVKLSRRVLPGMSSYRLGELARALGIVFRGTAHRAEADAEVAARLLMHIGRHLGDAYGLGPVAPELLVAINRLSAAKVHGYVGEYAAQRKAQHGAQD
jgi:DNA polymerase-3 subunit epsilon